jgi:ParB-like chromosome segregation protein Spo0J
MMRPLGDIDALAASIREVGLLNPISVTRDRRLISGLHRLEAFRALRRRTIPAIVLAVSRDEAQLREIDENLARNDLSLLERAEHLCRRKELYEQLHPETRKQGRQPWESIFRRKEEPKRQRDV